MREIDDSTAMQSILGNLLRLGVDTLNFYPHGSENLHHYCEALDAAIRFNPRIITVIQRGDTEAWKRGNFKRLCYRPFPTEALIIVHHNERANRLGGAYRYDLRIGGKVTARGDWNRPL